MTQRFSLPADPVDGYEFSAWKSEVDFTETGVREIRYVYHVARRWTDLYDPPGSDFENEWQVFDDGRFSGRFDGWLGPMGWLNGRDGHHLLTSKAEAQARTAERLRTVLIPQLKAELAADEQLLARIEAEMLVAGTDATKG